MTAGLKASGWQEAFSRKVVEWGWEYVQERKGTHFEVITFPPASTSAWHSVTGCSSVPCHASAELLRSCAGLTRSESLFTIRRSAAGAEPGGRCGTGSACSGRVGCTRTARRHFARAGGSAGAGGRTGGGSAPRGEEAGEA